MLDLSLTVTALTVLVAVAVAIGLAAVVAGFAPVIAASRRERLARRESLGAYYGHRLALVH